MAPDRVVPAQQGLACDQTLRAAIDEALRDWVADPDGTYYSIGSAVGPHPYPYLVRELQAVIGREARAQMLRAPEVAALRAADQPRDGVALLEQQLRQERSVLAAHPGYQRARDGHTLVRRPENRVRAGGRAILSAL